jgi:tRNA pseudouridine13 synthase
VKLRQRPEDFIVEEVSRLAPGGRGGAEGTYGLYRLRKRSITTPEAVRRVGREGGIERGRIRFSGLKDRHAITVQFVTIFGKAVGALEGPGFRLQPIGRSAKAAGPGEIERNGFRITLRDLSRDEATRARERAKGYARSGIPNYFDEQRFGSARATGVFPGELAARGDWEGALRLIIATSSREDSRDVKRRRRIVEEGWGDWSAVKAKLDRSSERSIVTYLADHPADFVGAFDRLQESLRTIVLSAFQSLVWNEVLSDLVRARCARTWTRVGRYDEVAFFEPGDDAAKALRGLAVPFPHRATKMRDGHAAAALDQALASRGLTLDSFRLRGLKKGHFWRGERAAVAEVGDFAAPQPMRDEMNDGKWALELRFSLPAGAYATIFVKAATHG